MDGFYRPSMLAKGLEEAAEAFNEAMEAADLKDMQMKISVFEKFMEELPQKALNLGIRVVLAIVFFFVGMQIIKLVRKILKKSLTKANADVGVVQFLDSLIKAILYVILILMIATSFGLDAASIVAVVGSAGVALGLALQGSLSNFAGGVLILLLKPFKVGDYIIEDTKGNEGTVSEIQLFYTKLTTPDERIVVLPNGILANSSLTNVTTTYKRRLTIKIGISYAADLKKAKEVMRETVSADEGVLSEEEVVTFVDDLADSSVVLGTHCYVANGDYWAVRWRLLENIKLAFDEEGISIPFPQLDVHVENQTAGQG